MKASSIVPSALITISFLAGCSGVQPSDVPASDAAMDVPTTDLAVSDGATDDTAEDVTPDVTPADDGVPADVVNVAYLGIVGETRPYAVLLQRNGHIRYRVTHVSTECTMVIGEYGPNLTEFFPEGTLRVSNGSRYYTLDLETGERTFDIGDGGVFAVPGDAVDFVTTTRGTAMPFPSITAHLRRPPAIAMLGMPPAPTHHLDRTQPLVLQWTPPTDATGITLHIGMFTQSDTGQNEMWCDYPAATGTVTIPSEVLSQFPAGTGDMSINAHSGQVDDLGGWHVRISYFNDATYPGASTYFYSTVVYE